MISNSWYAIKTNQTDKDDFGISWPINVDMPLNKESKPN